MSPTLGHGGQSRGHPGSPGGLPVALRALPGPGSPRALRVCLHPLRATHLPHTLVLWTVTCRVFGCGLCVALGAPGAGREKVHRCTSGRGHVRRGRPRAVARPSAPPAWGTEPPHRCPRSPGLATTPPPPQSHDESRGDATDLEDAGGLWPTFAALFLLTLLYSGFVTFIKVRRTAPLCAGLGTGRASPGSLRGAGGACGRHGPQTQAQGLGPRAHRPPPSAAPALRWNRCWAPAHVGLSRAGLGGLGPVLWGPSPQTRPLPDPGLSLQVK